MGRIARIWKSREVLCFGRLAAVAMMISLVVGASACTSTERRADAPQPSSTAGLGAGARSGSEDPACGESTGVSRTTESYRSPEGSDPDLTTFEVIRPERPAECGPTPVMIWVHGGGWQTGDRRNQLDAKVDLFTSMGWAIVSVNYRLSPDVTYPVHNEDVAAAIDRVLDRADQLGLDRDHVSVMGHSAGAGILAAVIADEGYLSAQGRSPVDLRCAVLLDTEGYDVAAKASGGSRLYRQAFGEDPATWDAASPIRHLTPGDAVPDTLVVTRGTEQRTGSAQAFVDALREIGGHAELFDAPGLTHAEVNASVGSDGDDVVTPVLREFLDRRC